MTKRLAVVSMLIALAGCGSPGPVYRGAPPPGMSHADYVRYLKGEREKKIIPEHRSVDDATHSSPDAP